MISNIIYYFLSIYEGGKKDSCKGLLKSVFKELIKAQNVTELSKKEKKEWLKDCKLDEDDGHHNPKPKGKCFLTIMDAHRHISIL